jgi:hypothetical protein
MSIGVSEEHVTSIYRVEEVEKLETSVKSLQVCYITY